MSWISDLKIGTKVVLVTAILIATSAIIGLVSMQTFLQSGSLVDQMERAANRSIYGERVNGLIYAVVMDSRGIYMSKDVPAAEKFVDGVRTNLKALDETMSEWRQVVEPEQMADFEKTAANAAEFVKFRTELARLGAEVSPQAADEYGNNDANRPNRKAFGQA